jgi:hypothetical protein
MTCCVITRQSRAGSKLDRFYRKISGKFGNSFSHQVGTILQNLACPRAKFLTNCGCALVKGEVNHRLAYMEQVDHVIALGGRRCDGRIKH